MVVTGMGSPLGQNIYKALKMSTLPLQIYLFDIYPFSMTLVLGEQPVICPPARHPDYLDQLIAFLNREAIDIVFFGTEVEPCIIAPHLDRLRRETPTHFILNDDEVFQIANDKLLTARFLHEAGLDSPASADAGDEAAVQALVDKTGFPLIVKPRHGSAARGLTRVKTMDTLRPLMLPGYVVQECLLPDDEEYTVGIYRCRNGFVASATTIHRHLEFGLTYKGIVISEPAIEAYAVQVVEALGAVASCNVQLRLTARGPVAFEVNPRFSSTTPIRAHFGVNEPEFAIREYVLGEELDRHTAREGGVLRYWQEYYLEADELAAVEAVDTTFWERGE